MIFTSTSSPALKISLHLSFLSQDESSLCNNPSKPPTLTNAPKFVSVVTTPFTISPSLNLALNSSNGFGSRFFKLTLRRRLVGLISITSTSNSSFSFINSFGFLIFLSQEISLICKNPSISLPKSTKAPYGSILLTVTLIVSPTSRPSLISSQGSGVAALIDRDRCFFSLSYLMIFTSTLSPSLYIVFGFTGPL